MLDVKIGREGPAPKAAATLLALRDGPEGLEVLVVERAKASRFLGGAVVFPGGKLDAADDPKSFGLMAADLPAPPPSFASADEAMALAIAACRECFEEAGLLFHTGQLAADELTAARTALAGGASLGEWLKGRGVSLAVTSLVPFARWVTPAAEARRFDARFYLARAPAGQTPSSDEHETTMVQWATPHALLERFARAECQLFPPTHRSLVTLAESATVDAALAAARAATLAPICPELAPHRDATGETLALVLPGDVAHSQRGAVLPGASRYVLRGEQWLPEAAPT